MQNRRRVCSGQFQGTSPSSFTGLIITKWKVSSSGMSYTHIDLSHPLHYERLGIVGYTAKRKMEVFLVRHEPVGMNIYCDHSATVSYFSLADA